jgi:uncharacterized protein
VNRVAPVNVIGKIGPRLVLLLQGGKDKSILSDSGERLFAAAHDPKEYWHEALPAHGTFYSVMPKAYERRIVAFFNQLL